MARPNSRAKKHKLFTKVMCYSKMTD